MKYFITTTLPYANANPHIGHLLEFLQADALTRYLKKDNEVFLNMGLDEHGLKIERKARSLKVHPQTYVDSIYNTWTKFCESFSIKYDNFYRTSNLEHERLVRETWLKLESQGLVKEHLYEGKYCVGCESFKTEDFCEEHQLNLVPVFEKNFFLNLSPFHKAIQEHGADLICGNHLSELLNYRIEELSISRSKNSVTWGIDCPSNPNQVIYVWFDALLNYIFAAPNWNENFTIQLCGPDNLKFQGYIFQAILAALGYKFTDKLLVHGTILDKQGRKLSKTLNNVIDPLEKLKLYGVEPIRYYILVGLSSTENCQWNDDHLIIKWNEIADVWGNLLSRVLNLVQKHGIEENSCSIALDLSKIKSAWKNFNIQLAGEETLKLAGQLNKLIEDRKPWVNPDKKQIGTIYKTLYEINKWFIPFIPNKCKEVDLALSQRQKVILFEKIV